MVDFGSVSSVDALFAQGDPDSPRIGGQLVQLLPIQRVAMLVSQEEPVSSPSHISANLAVTLHVHNCVVSEPVAGDVPNRDFAVLVKLGGHDPGGGFNPVVSCEDAAHPGKARNQPDGPVPTHPEVADVVEEDDTCNARGVLRLSLI